MLHRIARADRTLQADRIVSQETQAAEAGEVIIPVDYANAKIGADMVGAIPIIFVNR